jgi:lactate dehydrogenase-like 2-hydroxyacid dehydrogenase
LARVPIEREILQDRAQPSVRLVLQLVVQAVAVAGAALDVFASEPNLDPRFLALDNVVLQPRSASITHETRAAMLARLLGDIEAYVEGRPFHNAAATA